MVVTSYTTGQDGDRFIGDTGGTEIRDAQGFQIPSNDTIISAELYLKDGPTSPTDAITVRVETDSAGVPSGTLVDANATGTIAAASVTGTYQFLMVTFSGSFSLTASTQYHLVASVPNQSNDVYFIWGDDTTSPSYTGGTESQSFNGGAWGNAARDLLFKINNNIADSGFLTIL